MIEKFISHRGNIEGPTSLENSPPYVLNALDLGFDVEIDVWHHRDRLWLGHDAPQYPIDVTFLYHNGLWCHAKNIESLKLMLEDSKIHCFWHQNDDVTLTSKNYIWTYPGKKLADDRAIAVCPEQVKKWKIDDAYGVCSDFIKRFYETTNKK